MLTLVTDNSPFIVAELDARSQDTERALADKATARAAGFSLKPPVYAIGTAVNATGERNFRHWDVEPGYSKTAIVNAVTRAAHTEEWRSWTTSEDLERAAGELLYARVRNVQRPADRLV